MTAVDTIQGAINLLDELKQAATPGPWSFCRDTLQGAEGEWDNLIDAGDYAASSEQFRNPIDPALIATLHRTIDAQLAILRRHADLAEAIGASYPVSYEDFGVLDLARAILGEVTA